MRKKGLLRGLGIDLLILTALIFGGETFLKNSVFQLQPDSNLTIMFFLPYWILIGIGVLQFPLGIRFISESFNKELNEGRIKKSINIGISLTIIDLILLFIAYILPFFNLFVLLILR